ncbi:MAG: response regulator transcription factor [Acaryochloridaceae cyanobacterium SU_2_1]|nr:response regulator transcription factor [Acaryochloridaceae cyanobacterium SU_2_1]
MKLLLVEDDERIAEALAEDLSDQYYAVDIANDGLVGWELLEAFTYDLVLLDILLPSSWMDLPCAMRDRGFKIPVLMLTARDTISNKVDGLDAGADDYVVKPCSLEELSARIRALLRRGPMTTPPILEWGALQLNPNTCEVFFKEKLIPLTPKEYSLLELFLRNSRRVFSRAQILEHLWAYEVLPEEDTVKAHIKGLRQKLKVVGAPSDLIETVYGFGYRLKQIS